MFGGYSEKREGHLFFSHIIFCDEQVGEQSLKNQMMVVAVQKIEVEQYYTGVQENWEVNNTLSEEVMLKLKYE